MKNKYFHIILSLLLTIAVSDYLWIELFEDQQLVAELEIEKEKEIEEEFREKKSSETKHNFLQVNWITSSFLALFIPPSTSCFLKHGNSFCPLLFNSPPKLFILFSQLRLPS